MTSDMLAKNDLVLDGAPALARDLQVAGVQVAYGTDLLGQLQVEQSREFLFRAEVQKPIEIIRLATTVGAEILRQDSNLGLRARHLRPDRGRRRSAEKARAIPRPGRPSAGDGESQASLSKNALK